MGSINGWLLTYLLTPWSSVLLEKLTGFAANQEIPRILCNPKVHYRTHKRPPPVNERGSICLRIVLSPEEASRSWVFRNNIFSRGEVVSASLNPQAGGAPLVGCPRLLIQYIRSYPPYRRPFLHPQPEDAPCCGDRDPQMADYMH